MTNRTVFRRAKPNDSMSDMLALMFHRSTAVLYFVYIAWAIASVIGGIPTLIQAQGDGFQLLFSSLVLLCTLPACIGATFFPLFARLELYAGVAFSSLILVYLYFLIQRAATGESAIGVSVVVTLSYIVIPLCRSFIIYMFLLRQAKTETRIERE